MLTTRKDERMESEHIHRLIRHLRNASVKKMLFTFDGEREVCAPKYLLTSDRDFIISLLERELALQPAT